jgi:hypothetical protein
MIEYQVDSIYSLRTLQIRLQIFSAHMVHILKVFLKRVLFIWVKMIGISVRFMTVQLSVCLQEPE